MRNLIALFNGDLVNVNDILYVHPSKTEEAAYLYIKHLYHSNDKITHDAFSPVIKSKMIKITLEDYEEIRNMCLIENAPEGPEMILEN